MAQPNIIRNKSQTQRRKGGRGEGEKRRGRIPGNEEMCAFCCHIQGLGLPRIYRELDAFLLAKIKYGELDTLDALGRLTLPLLKRALPIMIQSLEK